MAETPKTNPDPKEAIEAKLCAYLEGDLAPAERGEIDKYLAANAGHRQLLTELKKTHGLLSALPRESAPPEIAEAFHQHLERSMLLDETDHTAVTKTNRWPQRMAIAAIVFLTFCLGGLVVYIVLPGGRLAQKTVAQKVTVPAGPTIVANSSAVTGVPNSPTNFDELDKNKPAIQNTNTPTNTLADSAKTVAAAPTVVPTPVPTLVAPGAAVATDDRTAEFALKGSNSRQFGLPVQVVLAAKPLDEQMLAPARKVAAANGLPADNTVYMVVSTDNPNASANQVRHFFAANSFAYKTMTAQTADSQSLPASANFNAAAGNVQSVSPAQSMANQQVQALGAMENRQANNQESLQQQNMAAQKDLSEDQQTFVAKALPRPLAVALNTALSTQRSGQTSSVYYLPNDEGLNNLGNAAPTSLSPTTVPADNFAGAGGGGFGGGGGGGGGGAAAVAAPSTEPAQTIATDQPLTVTIDQLVGPGVDKTSNVKVAADGTINLPMIEPVTAAGKTTADLQRDIADKYRQANLIHDATVTVTLGSPTTQPVASEIPATQPAKMPTELAKAPTTQPSQSDTVNVVVLLQPAIAPPATTEPATQPATTEPAVQ